MQYFRELSWRTRVGLTLILTIAAVLMVRARLAALSSREAEAEFRELFAALEKRDRQTWIKHVSPELQARILAPVAGIDNDEYLRGMFIDDLTPLLPRFQSRVNWNCSKVILTVHAGRLGPWLVMMKRSSGGTWLLCGRFYFVSHVHQPSFNY